MAVSFPNFAPAPSGNPAPSAGGAPSPRPAEGDAGTGGQRPDFQAVLSGTDSGSPAHGSPAVAEAAQAASLRTLVGANSVASALAGTTASAGSGVKASAANSLSSFWTPLPGGVASQAKAVAKKPQPASSSDSQSPTPSAGQGAGILAAAAPGTPQAPVRDLPAPAHFGGTGTPTSADPRSALDTAANDGTAVAKASAAGEAPTQASAVAPGEGTAAHSAGEKSAEPTARVYENFKDAAGASNKSPLAASPESVANSHLSLGTTVADSTAAMPAAPTPLAAPSFVGVLPGAPVVTAQPAAAAPPAQPVSAQALESALQVSDLQASASQGSQSLVNLRFNVAGENLSVRVALQEGQVHTRFSTDSGELRTALAHEWQSVGSASGTSRFAEPVFTSQSRPDSGPEMDLGGSGQQRDWTRGEADGLGSNPSQARGQQASTTPNPEPEAPTVGAERSGHLQSFA